MGRPRKLVGQQGPRRDAEASPTINLWQTDKIVNEEPGWVYEFPYEGDGKSRPNEVPLRMKPRIVTLRNFETGEVEKHQVPGWEVVHIENSEAQAAGYRPDQGAPIDTVQRQGPHVCMRIRKEHWDILQRAQEQRADAYEDRLQGGSVQDFDSAGRAGQAKPFAHVQPGDIRLSEKFTRETV